LKQHILKLFLFNKVIRDVDISGIILNKQQAFGFPFREL
jgi:hypothetical protein